ncbi:cation:proton antiporter [Brassicibacter mesophilus]|uniref:cation:proton antiporter n=1 Tax=Brassicibacter mesophilus TaxID=745119 RepID=UPI003D25C025
MNPFVSLGIALIAGIILGRLVGKFKVPSVAGYILAGLLIGVSGLKILNTESIEKLSFISDFALGIIAFNIGSELKYSVIKKLGKSIFVIAVCEALGAFTLVSLITFFITKQIAISLILGAVSSATAPAATIMVLKEFNAKGPLTSTLLGVVAIDDAICLMIYSVAASVAKVFVKHEVITLYKVLFHPIIEITLSVSIGVILGFILSYLLYISRNDSESLTLIIGIIVALVGISLKFGLSPLLSTMSLGVALANFSSKSRRAFSIIESFSPPFIAAFFTLAGARLNVLLLPQIGLIGVSYLLFRIVGKIAGAYIGASISKAPDTVRKNIGFGLLSQVGVAVGLAIVVNREFVDTNIGPLIITILLSTTIITEIIGPIATKNAIIKAKEVNL